MTDLALAIEIDDEIIEATFDDPATDVTVGDPDVLVVAVGGSPGPPGAPGAPGGEVTRLAAQILSGHRVVVPLDDGSVAYADATNIAHVNRPVWMTTGSWSAGWAAALVTAGPITEGSWAWSPGLVYLGANGSLTQSIPADAAFIRVVAEVISSTSIMFNPRPPIAI